MTHPAEGSETGEDVREPDSRDLMRRRNLEEALAVIKRAQRHDYTPTTNGEARDAA